MNSSNSLSLSLCSCHHLWSRAGHLILHMWVLTWAEYGGRITSLDLLSMLILIQPRMHLASWAVKTCCWIMSSMRTPAPFHRASLNELFSQYSCLGLAQLRQWTLHLVWLSLMGPFFSLVHVLLDGIPVFCGINRTTQLHAIFQLALSLTVYVTDKDIKELWPQNKDLRDTTRHWSPLRHRAIKHGRLSESRQPTAVHASIPCLSSVEIRMLLSTTSKAL